MAEARIAIAAIPNTGKTTLFNRLTGARQTVGNWAGVTVEKREGKLLLSGRRAHLVDLPGTYSLAPDSEEERIVRRYLLETPPDLLINVLDARNLYRGLGLTLQLAMSGLPLVVAVNMMDEARAQGLDIDLRVLSEHLGVPVVGISARSGEGLPRLREILAGTLDVPAAPRAPHFSLPSVLEQQVVELARRIGAAMPDTCVDDTFLALRLMEGGESTDRLSVRFPELRPVLADAEARRARVELDLGTSLTTACAQCRFNAARGLVLEATHNAPAGSDRLSRRLDAILLHPWLGLPLFFGMMLLLFQGIYAIGTPLQDAVGAAVTATDAMLRNELVVRGLPPWFVSLTMDGLFQGVGVVVSFFPIIALFFVFMSVIEASGYMARAAFIMDRFMHLLKLDGKAFINILLGYGCNVPAVMGTRILSSWHNRLLTMLLIPFSLCSARLQVFLFLAAILFTPRQAPWVVFGLYLGSFAAMIIVGTGARLLGVGGPSEPFIMEMPPYRRPMLRGVALRAWQEVKEFLHRAGTLIVLGVVFVWILTHLPVSAPPGSAETLAGRLGTALTPLFAPLGIQWQETVTLIFGFIAKEVVIGALAVVYGPGDLVTQVSSHFTPLQGLSFMVFTLLYTPCVATVAAIRSEARSWRVAATSMTMGLVLAWGASFTVYQAGLALGYGPDAGDTLTTPSSEVTLTPIDPPRGGSPAGRSDSRESHPGRHFDTPRMQNPGNG